jgi:hypothetical protein
MPHPTLINLFPFPLIYAPPPPSYIRGNVYEGGGRAYIRGNLNTFPFPLIYAPSPPSYIRGNVYEGGGGAYIRGNLNTFPFPLIYAPSPPSYIRGNVFTFPLIYMGMRVGMGHILEEMEMYLNFL